MEGLTTGVGPVLMAGGATLAITDPNKAKGLVYFSTSDSPSRWTHAVDSGLYFGGTAEGPYVAIAKSGPGKAAFIGDSSPIEDASPKYKRQDNGNTKSTYPGWTDAGNAAQLSINLIDWLATPESYTQFNSSAHPAGTVTPTPRARLFTEATALLPRGIPVNTILLPMEGDPEAASAFWKLAVASRGSFMSPASDWP